MPKLMSIAASGISAGLEGSDALAQTFTTLVEAEQRRVFHLCRNMLQDRDEADTATQDVFLKAFAVWERDSAGLEEPSKWITRITVNVCLDRLRSKRWRFWRMRSKSASQELVMQSVPDGSPSAEDRLFAEQIKERLVAAMPRLSDRQRAVFVLRHYEGKSIEEIADVLGLEEGSVKSHLFRALEKMRKELRDLYAAGQASLDR